MKAGWSLAPLSGSLTLPSAATRHDQPTNHNFEPKFEICLQNIWYKILHESGVVACSLLASGSLVARGVADLDYILRLMRTHNP